MQHYSHSYYDEDTDEEIDVFVDDGEPGADYRNAVRDHRSGSRTPYSSSAPRSRTRHPFVSSGPPSRVVERARPRNPNAVRPRPPARPVARPVARPPTHAAIDDGEYLAIKKSALAELLSAVGPVWASLLGRPEIPEPVGDDATDRTNAAMHRDALAQHQQNQTRILAFTGLAERAARLLLQ